MGVEEICFIYNFFFECKANYSSLKGLTPNQVDSGSSKKIENSILEYPENAKDSLVISEQSELVEFYEMLASQLAEPDPLTLASDLSHSSTEY
jgi:hypothetical protein